VAEPDYFTLAELRALPDMSSETDERILAAAAWAVGIIEREVGTSFVPRTVVDEAHDGSGAVLLNSPYVTSVTSVSLNGVAAPGTYTARAGVLRLNGSSYSPSGDPDVSVTYESGYSTTPPPDIKEAALQATRWHLIEGRATNDRSARQTSMTNDMGGTVNFAVAGPDRPTGYPDVDAVIIGWRNKLSVLGFA
jgi:hypothetical protein